MENAMITLAQHENSIAVQKEDHHYSEQMARQITFPTDTLQELLDVHTDCEREAIAVFMEHSFGTTNRSSRRNLRIPWSKRWRTSVCKMKRHL